MSLREKTISGAKWSAIATVIIIGLGLVQMTVLARIIDNHQFGFAYRVAGDYRAGRYAF